MYGALLGDMIGAPYEFDMEMKDKQNLIRVIPIYVS